MNKALETEGVAWLVACRDSGASRYLTVRFPGFNQSPLELVEYADDGLKFADKASAETFRDWADRYIKSPAEFVVEDHRWMG